MELAEWVHDGRRRLYEWKAAERSMLYATINSFHGYSAYDRHTWYRAAKSMANALLWSAEVLPGPGDPDAVAAIPSGDFAESLVAYRSVADLMIRELDRHAEDYRKEHDVKEPPDPLTTVRGHAVAFRAAIQQVIERAPPGFFRPGQV